MIDAHTQMSFMDEDEMAKLIAKTNKCQKVGIITSGDECYLAFFKTPQSKRPMGIAPIVAAMMVIEEYVENVMPKATKTAMVWASGPVIAVSGQI